jgi:hypothetical protein
MGEHFRVYFFFASQEIDDMDYIWWLLTFIT